LDSTGKTAISEISVMVSTSQNFQNELIKWFRSSKKIYSLAKEGRDCNHKAYNN